MSKNTIEKKTTSKPKKSTPKKTKAKKNTIKYKSKFFKKPLNYYINISIFVLIFLILAFLANSLLFNTNENQKEQKIIKTINNTINNQFEEQTKELNVEYINTSIPKKELQITNIKKPPLFNENTNIVEKNNTKKEILSKEKINKKINTVIRNNISQKKQAIVVNDNIKPKLAIIIDDVTTSKQVKKANNLPFKVTLSFLPPTPTHKKSALLAQNLSVHMIHLPLEASKRTSEEINTLHVGDSLEKIDNRIKYLKSIYPKVKYINNHTGSKFTSDLESMNKLIKTLKKYNYYFVDSRTTAKSKIKPSALKYNLPYLSRNVFLDNKQDIAYIHNQLKKAVKIAKTKGSAIAICHPYSITYKALNSSLDILKGVELVYINKLKISSPR